MKVKRIGAVASTISLLAVMAMGHSISAEEVSTEAFTDVNNTQLSTGTSVSDGTENTGIVRIEANGSNDGGATGFIIDDHLIATAAHCVYNNSPTAVRHWKQVTINLYDENGIVTDVQLNPVEIHIPAEYVDSDDNAYDYALITVEEDLSNINNTSLGEDYECTFFSLGTPYNVSADAYSNVPIYVTGSPIDLPNVNDVRHLYSAEGRVINNQDEEEAADNTDVLYYNVDTGKGQSGAPVYTITKHGNSYTYTALAIHHGGTKDVQNWGSMITNYHLQFYYNNPNMSYTNS